LSGERLLALGPDCSLTILDAKQHLEWEWYDPKTRITSLPLLLDDGAAVFITDHALLSLPAQEWTALPESFESEHMFLRGNIPLGQGQQLLVSDRHDFIMQYASDGSIVDVKACNERPGKKVLDGYPTIHVIGLSQSRAAIVTEWQGAYVLDSQGAIVTKLEIIETTDLAPCYDGERLFIPALGKRELRCFDSSLKLAWTYKSATEMYADPICTNSGAVLLCNEENLVALDVKTGAELVSLRLPDGTIAGAMFAASDDTLGVTTFDGQLLMIQ